MGPGNCTYLQFVMIQFLFFGKFASRFPLLFFLQHTYSLLLLKSNLLWKGLWLTDILLVLLLSFFSFSFVVHTNLSNPQNMCSFGVRVSSKPSLSLFHEHSELLEVIFLHVLIIVALYFSHKLENVGMRLQLYNIGKGRASFLIWILEVRMKLSWISQIDENPGIFMPLDLQEKGYLWVILQSECFY